MSIEINKGDFVAIVGPSGSGKSTIMNIIGALDTPTSGDYLLRNKNISKYKFLRISGYLKSEDDLSVIRNQEIGFIFQSFNLLPRTSVLKNVERPMMYAGVPSAERTKRALQSLDVVGLADKASNLSNHISGGQIQRVAIARALVMNPSLLLADEPTGNLDSKTANEIMEFFTELNKKGSTIVLITHEDEIAQYAHRVIHIKDGVVLKEVKNSLKGTSKKKK